MKNKTIFAYLSLVLVVGVLAFFGGVKYQQSKNPRFAVRNSFENRGPSGQNQNNFRPVSGEIIQVDEKSITVRLADGSSKIVVLGDSTVISKFDSATKEDLKVGTRVAVFGVLNQDGSVVASSIQLNPAFRGQ